MRGTILHGGGVSTWCDTLIRKHARRPPYTLLPLMIESAADEFRTSSAAYARRRKLRRMMRGRYGGHRKSLSEFITTCRCAAHERAHPQTRRVGDRAEFLPILQNDSRRGSSRRSDCDVVGTFVVADGGYFRPPRTLQRTLKSPVVWDAFIAILEEHGRESA